MYFLYDVESGDDHFGAILCHPHEIVSTLKVSSEECQAAIDFFMDRDILYKRISDTGQECYSFDKIEEERLKAAFSRVPFLDKTEVDKTKPESNTMITHSSLAHLELLRELAAGVIEEQKLKANSKT